MAVILIVEDYPFIRELTEITIQEWGYETLSAGNVDEALTLLRSTQHIDLLFSDIYLAPAVLGGCELACQAIELRPELRVLYTSGNLITDQMRALFIAGSQFLRKPYLPRQLQNCFDGLLTA
jgi:CheY-like chemotaxis protein